MGVITVVLYTLVIIIALMLIGLVLIQQSKGGGFGSSFGGVGESVFGAHAGSHLTKMTVILTSSFFVLTLLLAVIVSRSDRGLSVGETAALQKAVVASKEAKPSVKADAKAAVKAEDKKDSDNKKPKVVKPVKDKK